MSVDEILKGFALEYRKGLTNSNVDGKQADVLCYGINDFIACKSLYIKASLLELVLGVLPEKKEDLCEYLCEESNWEYCLYDVPNGKETCVCQDKGIPKEKCSEYKQILTEQYAEYNQALTEVEEKLREVFK